jgi:hypothetical protein
MSREVARERAEERKGRVEDPSPEELEFPGSRVFKPSRLAKCQFI